MEYRPELEATRHRVQGEEAFLVTDPSLVLYTSRS